MSMQMREGPEDPDWVPVDPNIKAVHDIARYGGVGWWDTEIDPKTGFDKWLIFRTPEEVEYRIDLIALDTKKLRDSVTLGPDKSKWLEEITAYNQVSSLFPSICNKVNSAKSDLAFSQTFTGEENPEIDPIDSEDMKEKVNFTMTESFSAGGSYWYKGFDKLMFRVNEVKGKPMSIEARSVHQMQICIRDEYAFLRFKRFSTDSQIVIRYTNKTRAFNIYSTISNLYRKAEDEGHGLIIPVL